MINLNLNSSPVLRDLTLNEERFGKAALISMFIGSVFVHEYSHVFTARSLFLDVKHYISCNFYSCQVNWEGPLRVPESSTLGYNFRLGIVDAAGPISDMIMVALSAMAAWKMRDSHKKISLLFATHAFALAINDFGYAAMTHWTKIGDFANVETNFGIPHYIQTAITGAVALGAFALVKYLLSEKPLHTYNLRPRTLKNRFPSH